MKRAMLLCLVCTVLVLSACSSHLTATPSDTGITAENTAGTQQTAQSPTPESTAEKETQPSADSTTAPDEVSAPTQSREPDATDATQTNPTGTQPPVTPPDTETQKPAQTNPPAHQHRYTAAVTRPNCTAQSFTTYTCACGSSYRADTTAALGHMAGDWIVTKEAVVGAPGQRERRCTRCQTFMQTEAIPALRDPNSVTAEEEARIIREVKAYAESYAAKGFTFEWKESMEFSWEVGWMGTPRVRYEGVDGVIRQLKYHVDKIVKTSTDPANGITTDYMTYKVVKTMADGDVAFAVIYGG